MKKKFTKAMCFAAAICLLGSNLTIAKADVSTVNTEVESTLTATAKTLVSGKVYIGTDEKYINKNAFSVVYKTPTVNGNAQVDGAGADIPFTYDVVNGTGTITDGGNHNFTKANMTVEDSQVVKISANGKNYHTKAEHNLKAAMQTKEVKLNSDFLTGKTSNDKISVGDTIKHLGSDFVVKEMKAEVSIGGAPNTVNLPNTHVVIPIEGWKDDIDVQVKYTVKLEAKPITEKTISISTDNEIWNYKGAGSWKELAIINGGTKTILKKGQKHDIKFANPDKIQVVVSNRNSNVNLWNGEIKFDNGVIQLKPETNNNAHNIWYTPNNTEKNFYGYVQNDYKVGFKLDGDGLKFQEVIKPTGQNSNIVDTNYYTYDVQAKDSEGNVIKGITIKDTILNSLIGYDYPLIQQGGTIKWGDGNTWSPFLNGNTQKYLGDLTLKTDANGSAKPIVNAKASYGGSSDREYSVSLHGDIRQEYKSESYSGQSKAILNLNSSFINPNSSINVYTDLQPKSDNVLGSYYDVVSVMPFGKSIQILDPTGNKIADVSMGVRTSKDTAPIQNTQYMLLGNKSNQRKSLVDSSINYSGVASKDWEVKIDYAEGNNNDQNSNNSGINYYGQPYNQNGQAYTPKYNLNAPTAIFHISVIKKTPIPKPQETNNSINVSTGSAVNKNETPTSSAVVEKPDATIGEDESINNEDDGTGLGSNTGRKKSKKSKKHKAIKRGKKVKSKETDAIVSDGGGVIEEDTTEIDGDDNPEGNTNVTVNKRVSSRTRRYQPAEPRTGESRTSYTLIYIIMFLGVSSIISVFVLYKKGLLKRFIK